MEKSVIASTVNARQNVAVKSSVRSLTSSRKKFINQLLKAGLDQSVAEDLFHSSLMQVISKLDKLRDPTKLEAWFKVILKNQVNDHFRAQKKQILLEQDLTYEVESLSSLNVDLCKCSLKLLYSLKNEYLDVLKYRYLEGQSVKQTATRLKISENAVKVTSHRAKEKLKENLQKCCGIKKFSETNDCDCDDA